MSNHNLLLELFSIIQIKDVSTKSIQSFLDAEYFKSQLMFDVGKSAVVEKNQGRRFIEIVQELLSEDKELMDTVSFTFYEKKLWDAVVEHKQNDSSIPLKNRYETFKDQMLSMSIQNGSFYRPISNIYLSKKQLWNKSGFSIYDTDHTHTQSSQIDLWKKTPAINFKYYISFLDIKAREREKVKEIGYSLFNDFLYVFNFMIGGKKDGVKIPKNDNFSDNLNTHCIVLGNETTTSLNTEISNPIPIDDDYFNTDIHNLIWGFICNKNMSTWESRVYKAILLVGKAIDTQDLTNSFLNLTTALEILLNLQEDGIFQLSIGQRIADGVAFLIAKDLNNRLALETKIKKLYGLRSAISHSGSKTITNLNFTELLAYVRLVIYQLLNLNIKTENDFKAYMRKCRYT